MPQKHSPTRRDLLRQSALAAGTVALIAEEALGQGETAQGRIVVPEEGIRWEMEPERLMTFKLLSEQTRDSVSIFEEIVPPGAGTPLHIHHTSDEAIHLLAGELMIRLGAQVTTVSAGTWIFIPRGTTHGWKNRSNVPVRASYTFTPSDGAKVFELARVLGRIPSDSPATMAKFDALCKRYGYERVALEWE
jgi:quercetin dioxygenase-like cupin family protein